MDLSLDKDWKKKLGFQINFKSDSEEDPDVAEVVMRRPPPSRRSTDYLLDDVGDGAEADLLSSTPPRALIRKKEKARRPQPRFAQSEYLLDVLGNGAAAGLLSSTPPRALIRKKEKARRWCVFGRENIDEARFQKMMRDRRNTTVYVSSNDSPVIPERLKKRWSLKRSTDRDWKNEMGLRGEPKADSLPLTETPAVPTLVESCSRFMSLTSRLKCRASHAERDNEREAPQEQLPESRVNFHRTFSMLINMGNVDKGCRRTISREEQVWQNELKDLIWLELQAKIAGRSLAQQDLFLCSQRNVIPTLINNIIDYKFINPNPCKGRSKRLCAANGSREDLTNEYPDDETDEDKLGCLSFDCRLCSSAIGAAMTEVRTLLESFHRAGALYPSTQAMTADHKLLATSLFQNRIKVFRRLSFDCRLCSSAIGAAMTEVRTLLESFHRAGALYPSTQAMTADHKLLATSLFQNRIKVFRRLSFDCRLCSSAIGAAMTEVRTLLESFHRAGALYPSTQAMTADHKLLATSLFQNRIKVFRRQARLSLVRLSPVLVRHRHGYDGRSRYLEDKLGCLSFDCRLCSSAIGTAMTEVRTLLESFHRAGALYPSTQAMTADHKLLATSLFQNRIKVFRRQVRLSLVRLSPVLVRHRTGSRYLEDKLGCLSFDCRLCSSAIGAAMTEVRTLLESFHRAGALYPSTQAMTADHKLLATSLFQNRIKVFRRQARLSLVRLSPVLVRHRTGSRYLEDKLGCLSFDCRLCSSAIGAAMTEVRTLLESFHGAGALYPSTQAMTADHKLLATSLFQNRIKVFRRLSFDCRLWSSAIGPAMTEVRTLLESFHRAGALYPSTQAMTADHKLLATSLFQNRIKVFRRLSFDCRLCSSAIGAAMTEVRTLLESFHRAGALYPSTQAMTADHKLLATNKLGCLSFDCRLCSSAIGAAMTEVRTLLESFHRAGALYPSTQAMTADHKLLATSLFQNRIKALCLWYNMAMHMRLKILSVRRLLATVGAKGRPTMPEYPCVEPSIEGIRKDRDADQCSQRQVRFNCDNPTSSTNSDESCPTENQSEAEKEPLGQSESGAEESGVAQSDGEKNKDETDCVIRTDETGQTTPEIIISDAKYSTNDTSTSSESGYMSERERWFNTSSSESVFNVGSLADLTRLRLLEKCDVSPYREYHYEILKIQGVRRSMMFIHKLRTKLLNKVYLTFLQPESTLDESSREEDLTDASDEKDDKTQRARAGEDEHELRRFGCWSEETLSMGLPSYRNHFLLLSSICMEAVHDYLTLRLEGRPEHPSCLTIKQLIHELKEGLDIATTMRQAFVGNIEVALRGCRAGHAARQDLLLIIKTFDASVEDVFKQYLSYLSAMSEVEHMPRSCLEAEWSFVARVAERGSWVKDLAPVAFTDIACNQLNRVMKQFEAKLIQVHKVDKNSTDPNRYVFYTLCREAQSVFAQEREAALQAAAFARALASHHARASLDATRTRRRIYESLFLLRECIVRHTMEILERASKTPSEEYLHEVTDGVVARVRDLLLQIYRLGFEVRTFLSYAVCNRKSKEESSRKKANKTPSEEYLHEVTDGVVAGVGDLLLQIYRLGFEYVIERVRKNPPEEYLHGVTYGVVARVRDLLLQIYRLGFEPEKASKAPSEEYLHEVTDGVVARVRDLLLQIYRLGFEYVIERVRKNPPEEYLHEVTYGVVARVRDLLLQIYRLGFEPEKASKAPSEEYLHEVTDGVVARVRDLLLQIYRLGFEPEKANKTPSEEYLHEVTDGVVARVGDLLLQIYRLGFELHRECYKFVHGNRPAPRRQRPASLQPPRTTLVRPRRPETMLVHESVNPMIHKELHRFVNERFGPTCRRPRAPRWLLRSESVTEDEPDGTFAEIDYPEIKTQVSIEELLGSSPPPPPPRADEAPHTDEEAWSAAVARAIVCFARCWMRFVLERCERGRGRRPRWASQGLEFLMLACDPYNTRHLSDEEFEELKHLMDGCISHVIGSRGTTKGPESEPSPRPRHRLHSPLPSQSGASKESLTPSTPPGEPEAAPNFNVPDPHARTRSVMEAIKKLDMSRDAALRSMKAVGRVAEPAVTHDYEPRVRQVTFKWQRGLKIGAGTFGKVYTVVNTETGQLLAMKEVSIAAGDRRAMQRAANELRVLEGAQHPHLVRYYGIEVHREEMLIFMELCVEGSLETLIATSGALPEQTVRRYTAQLLSAVSELHARNIAHRDIKSGNIFLMNEGHCLKLGDFGCAVKIRATTTAAGELQGYVGTQAYMAPEVFMKSDGHGRATDIWSLGCVVTEMASGKRPFPEYDSNYQIMFVVGMGGRPHIPESLSEEGQQFCLLCLTHDPDKRPKAEALKLHHFLMVKNDECYECQPGKFL
ncbi:uncharacterized protein LOC134655718 [Cydia amplana]|uniref:uncharacterized protein LOC134655718 n=1 Tax=Cydia amplana TaxID=1869771 RepID=UPI002FE656D4